MSSSVSYRKEEKKLKSDGWSCVIGAVEWSSYHGRNESNELG